MKIDERSEPATPRRTNTESENPAVYFPICFTETLSKCYSNLQCRSNQKYFKMNATHFQYHYSPRCFPFAALSWLAQLRTQRLKGLWCHNRSNHGMASFMETMSQARYTLFQTWHAKLWNLPKKLGNQNV